MLNFVSKNVHICFNKISYFVFYVLTLFYVNIFLKQFPFSIENIFFITFWCSECGKKRTYIIYTTVSSVGFFFIFYAFKCGNFKLRSMKYILDFNTWDLNT